jgi:NADH-quinone oxidoreductase subunit K
MHLLYPLVVSALLFSIGVYGVLARRNAILVLLSVELMLNAVNLNLVAFDVWLRDELHTGQVFTLYVITIAAAEIGLGLAIVLLVFRQRQTADIDTLRDLGEYQYDTLVDAAAAGDGRATATLPSGDPPASSGSGQPESTIPGTAS